MTTIESTQGTQHPASIISGLDPCCLLQSRIAAAISEIGELVAALPNDTLARSGGPVFQNATIGQHLRHVLDHVRTVTCLHSHATLDYDTRDRGTPIEHDHAAARIEIARLTALLARPPSDDRPLMLHSIATPQGERVTMRTTHARELAFVLSHTVHHAATIRSIAAFFGITTSSNLGLAPATQAHRSGATSCAH